MGAFREPMFLITDAAYSPLGAVAVEGDRWVGRDTAGRKLFDRRNQAGATAAANRMGLLVSSAWYGIRATYADEARFLPDASKAG